MSFNPDAAPKKQWRNNVAKYIAARAMSGPILYLAAIDNRDYLTLLRAGFGPDRLIGITTDESVVAELRERGCWAIQGDVESIVGAWPEDWPIGGIIADFYGTVVTQVPALAKALLVSRGVCFGTVCVVNCAAGHEPSDLCEWFRRAWTNAPELRNHRGAWALWLMMKTFEAQGLPVPLCEKWLALIAKQPNLRFASYIGHKIPMHSVAFHWPVTKQVPITQLPPEWRTARQRIAALRAVRTKQGISSVT